jgi:hypothetical protein
MSQFYEYSWPVINPDDIALDQTVIAGKLLTLNGKYANLTNGQANLIEAGIIPQITLTSGSNLSAVSFIITGYQNGVFIQEPLAGPNATIVSSENYFDIIESILPQSEDEIVGNITVGINSVGFFSAILLNTEKKIANPAGAIRFIAAEENPATYVIYTSLNNISNSQPYNTLIENHILQSVNLEGDTISQTLESNYVAKNLVIQISKNAENVPLKMQFLQL